MMRSEFQEKVESLNGSVKNLTSDDYSVIEFVYMYHPSVNDKLDIARIYVLPGGMRIIRDMVGTAQEAKRIEEEQNALRRKIDELQKQMNDLAIERQLLSK